MKRLLPALFCLLLWPPLSTADIPVTSLDESLAGRLLIVDAHIDLPWLLHRKPEVDFLQSRGEGDFDLPRARAGGLNAPFMSIYVPARVDEAGGARQLADELIDLVEGLVRLAPDDFGLATCTRDLKRHQAEGRISLPMGMENGGPLAGSLASLRHFRDRGIRYITLAHSKSNHISDSSYDENEPWQGLSPFGRQLVRAMNDEGVMIDISHLSDRAAWQVLELSRVPVLATHSSLRHFTPGFHRNMSDEMLGALASQGGVLQINYGSGFLTQKARDWSRARSLATDAFRADRDRTDEEVQAFRADWQRDNPYPFADLQDLLDHIDRAVAIAGIRHVGLGSDYEGVGDTLPTGLKDAASYPRLIAGLRARGYSRSDIGRILGQNTLRVWRRAEKYAAARGNPPVCSAGRKTR